MKRSFGRFCLGLVLAVFLACLPLAANDANRTDLTLDVISSSTTLAAAATTAIIRTVGQSEIQGLDWYITSASAVNIGVVIKSSNSATGPWATWTSVPGTTATTSWTITSGTNGTDLRLFPSKYIQITLTNNAAVSATIVRMSLFTY